MSIKKQSAFLIFSCLTLMVSCQHKNKKHYTSFDKNLLGIEYLDSTLMSYVYAIRPDSVQVASFSGMKKIKGGSFAMGADETTIYLDMPATAKAQLDEYPKHAVLVSAFWMDEHEVTNAQFAAFVKATGYITTAERTIDWNTLKKQLPPGTPKPADSTLLPTAAVFFYPARKKETYWWKMTTDANWKHPQGIDSNIDGKENDPVAQVSWYDALAYCRWAGKRLPTEAEYEFAARGGLENAMYAWGDTKVDAKKANYFQGEFPYQNTPEDGYEFVAPVKSFPPNGYGLYDITGNVWEWCSDWYDAQYYDKIGQKKSIPLNPKGPEKTNELHQYYAVSKVIRGGSFLCSDSWCSGFRNSRRMRLSPDSGMQHTGFRCVKDVN